MTAGLSVSGPIWCGDRISTCVAWGSIPHGSTSSGELAERSIATVLEAVNGSVVRGFESRTPRHILVQIRSLRGYFSFSATKIGSWLAGRSGT